MERAPSLEPTEPSDPMPARRPLYALHIAAVVVAAGGCDPSIPEPRSAEASQSQAEYIVVEFRPGRDETAEPAADVKLGPGFRDARPRLKSAVIRPPDACLEDQSAMVLGAPVRTTLSLRAPCAPWVAELELVLADGGLQIVPWTAIVGREREKNLATLVAAKDLHADVVFSFHRLELSDVLGADGVPPRLRYFAADAQGNTFGARPVDRETTLEVERFVSEVLGGSASRGETTALATSVDATALLSDTGDAIWTYQRSVTRPVGKTSGMRFLFGRYGDAPWSAVSPAADLNGTHLVTTLGTQVIRAERALSWMAHIAPAETMHEYDGERYELLHSGAIDFVRAFQGTP